MKKQLQKQVSKVNKDFKLPSEKTDNRKKLEDLYNDNLIKDNTNLQNSLEKYTL